jgi:hypothetical protein
MALLGLFDTKEIEEFAKALADDFGRRFPPASEARTDKGATRQVEVIVDGLSARAIRFREDRKLGLYKKAKLANVFRWRLTELGYSKPFVERISKAVATRLAMKI